MSEFLSESIQSIPPSATEEVFSLVKQMKQNGINDIRTLDIGEPDFDTPENIVNAGCRALREGQTKYEATVGAYELREEISKKLKVENAIDVSADDIIVTPGAKFAVYCAFQALLEPGDQVMILDPAWVTYESVAMMMGARVINVPTNKAEGFLPDLEAIKGAMNKSVKIIVLNSPCNPTGVVFDKSAIREIAQIAEDNGALVLSDEVYEYLIYEGEHYSPGSEFDNIITVNSFSKSYAMTGWRLGYVTGPQEVLEGIIKVYQYSAGCVTAFSQAGAIEALRAEASKKSAKQMVDAYRERRKVMMGLIEESEFFNSPKAPQGAFYCFPSYASDQPSVEFAKALLREAHVSTVPGAAFGKHGENHLRLSFAVTTDVIQEAFNRMDLFFRKSQR